MAVLNQHDLDTVTLPDGLLPLSILSFGLTDVGKVRASLSRLQTLDLSGTKVANAGIDDLPKGAAEGEDSPLTAG